MPVRTFTSFGAPHTGISLVPGLSQYSNIGNLVNSLVNKVVNLEAFQNFVAPSNYWKNIDDEEGYLNHSKFLAISNNESYFNSTKREIWLSLKYALFIKFSRDKVIVPKESSWWGGYTENFTEVSRFETKIYQQDLLGIKTLEETGKAEFQIYDGEHMAISNRIVLKMVYNVLIK
jgi:palmitoyl-protein thioesterase